MAIEFNWKIDQFDIHVEKDNKSNVIYNIHWRYVGQEQIDENNPEAPVYFDALGGQLTMDKPNEDFIEYESVTKEVVVGWLENKIDVEELKNTITEKISNQRTPKTNHIKPNFE